MGICRVNWKISTIFQVILNATFSRIVEIKPTGTLLGSLLSSHRDEMMAGECVFRSHKCCFQWLQRWSIGVMMVSVTWAVSHLGKESVGNSSSRQGNSAPASLEIDLKWRLLVNLSPSFLHRMCLLRVYINIYWVSFWFFHYANVSLNVGLAVVSPSASCLQQLCLLFFIRWFSTPKKRKVTKW